MPLRRLCPARLNLAALVIGSMSPDFVYFVGQYEMRRLSHSLLGSFVVCLPAGFLVLGIFYVLRESLAFILPQPHRSVLMPLASVRPRLSPWSWLRAGASLLLGTWTHIIWDSFTHDNGWAVRRMPFLRERLFQVGGAVFSIHYVIFLACSFGGSAFLIVAYVVWLRHRRLPVTVPSAASSDRKRYCLLATLVFVALAVGVLIVLRSMGSSFHGFAAFQEFTSRAAVAAIAVFTALLALASAIFHLASRRRAE